MSHKRQAIGVTLLSHHKSSKRVDLKRIDFKEDWWRIWDLNLGPSDYDSAALTTELIRQMGLCFRYPSRDYLPPPGLSSSSKNIN